MFGRMVKLPLRVQWNSDGKLYFLGKMNVFLSFPHLMWNIFATSNEIGRLVNLAFIISSRTFWGKRCLNETVFMFSPIFDSEQKTLGRVLTSASYASRGTFGGEPYFEMIFYFNSGEWHLVQLRTAIYMSRRTFLATLFWKISFLFWFSDFEQKSCNTFRELLTAIISELTSMCTEEQIEKTSFLWKIQIFLIISGLWAITQYNFG